MGNRAIITAAPYKRGNPAIYIHWNGGQGSVQAFCNVAHKLGVRDPASDSNYAMGRLAQIIANYFGGTLSLGLCKAGEDWSCDNGFYTIGENWKLVQSKAKGAAILESVGQLDEYESKQLRQVYFEALDINKPIFERV